MEVSLVFLGDQAIRNVNKTWRKKDARANVLAFPLDAGVGEVVVNPYEAEREAHETNVPYAERIAYLFLHGLLHLYGYNHEIERDAKKMEQKERKIMQNIHIKIRS